MGTPLYQVEGGRTKDAFYNTIQCVDGECNCKYDYCATGKHKVWKVSEYQPFRAASDWLHQEHNVALPDRFDEIVANIYSREKKQCAGAHTDQSRLLGETSDIVSVSLGAAGVFYWRPSQNGKLWGANSGYSKPVYRRAAEQQAGLWGACPLLPGDMMLCCGRFQHELEHGTLTYSEAADVAEVVKEYQLCPNAHAVLQLDAYRKYFDKTRPQPERSVITFRKIVNHDAGCPERAAWNGSNAEPQPLRSCPLPAGMPQCHQGRAVSPEDVRDPAALEQQVEDRNNSMQKLCKTLYAIDDGKREEQLTIQFKDCARIQNIALCSPEVASPLYLIFKMIIPVM